MILNCLIYFFNVLRLLKLEESDFFFENQAIFFSHADAKNPRNKFLVQLKKLKESDRSKVKKISHFFPHHWWLCRLIFEYSYWFLIIQESAVWQYSHNFFYLKKKWQVYLNGKLKYITPNYQLFISFYPNPENHIIL